MEGVEVRMARLETQVRRYRRLTIYLLSITLLLILGAALFIWRSIPKTIDDIAGGDVVGRSLQIWDTSLPRLKVTATEAGWTLQVPIVNEGWAKADAATVAYKLSNGRPTLTMTDADGKEVWRAP